MPRAGARGTAAWARPMHYNQHMKLEAIPLAQVFACAFFAACFLQSSLDKIFDWKGNMEWLVPHFAKTPMRNQVALMLGALTILEFATGVTCAISVILLLMGNGGMLPLYAMALACLSLFVLFAGQRIAKDYAGAASLAAYFVVALLGLSLMAGR